MKLTLRLTLALITGALLVPVHARQDSVAPSPLRISAFAVNMSNIGTGQTAQVSIVIDRWSTEPEREQLTNVLIEKGPEHLLDALHDAKAVGRIMTPGSIGYELRYSRRTAFGDGGTKIVLATDRPIGGWEAVNRPRVSDYPFTLIELRLNSNGQGEGKLSIATKVSYDQRDRAVELETYASEPVRLEQVKIESGRDPR